MTDGAARTPAMPGTLGVALMPEDFPERLDEFRRAAGIL